ncbi:hypothetical protein [Aureimonas sp. N4]|uniref:hypothetical protein n=1 Tax=Aureimonas sp. N4 TaxID=1638165 RepID=UPI000782EABD|nr:hypothetical protein [Aureimonas sp. N4]
MTDRSPVTEHASLRWLERVRHVDFSRCTAHFGQHDLVQHGCRELGLTPAEAREEIAPERVRDFIERGATAIRYPSWTLVVDGGSIVTVLPHGMRRYWGSIGRC